MKDYKVYSIRNFYQFALQFDNNIESYS